MDCRGEAAGVRWGILITGLTLLSAVRIAHATDRHWNVGSGLWSASANWNPTGVPTSADDAFIDFFDFGTGAGGFSRLNTAAVSAVNSVTVSNSATLTLSNQALNAGSLLVGGDVIVGASNLQGALNVQSGSTLTTFTGGMTINSRLRLGALSGAGTVTQNAGTINVGLEVRLGDSNQPGSTFNPSGTYTQSGGVLFAPSLKIGSDASNARGTFNLSGFGLVNVEDMRVGEFSGVGTFNQSGGTSSAGTLWVGGPSASITPPPGIGHYNMSGGTLEISFTNVALHSALSISGGSASLGFLAIWDDGRIDVSNGPDRTVKANTLAFANAVNAVIDLRDNTMDLSFGGSSQRDVLREQLQRGYDGGSWTGKGITSSTAAANASAAHPTALGFAPFPGTGFRVDYTYYGDANLDGQVDVTDLGALATNWQSSGAFWFNGDFNYDGFVDVTDLGLLATNWQAGVVNPSAMTFQQQLATLGLTNLPEPAMLALLACSIALFSRCGRRRRR